METEFSSRMRIRAKAIARHGGIDQAITAGELPKQFETSLSEGLVLGLLKQGVRKYLAIFGHGSTDLGEVLRVYEEEGVTRTWNFRNEVAMAHAGVKYFSFGPNWFGRMGYTMATWQDKPFYWETPDGKHRVL
jgi:3D-(3,5/4)-trihydroxycyclohexane-1,2-dione acylhydrolase (decyclizing)